MKVARVLAIARKEWREIVRDRLLVALAFLLPVLLMGVLGYGLTQDVDHIPLVIVDEDHTAASRDYAQPFRSSRYFQFAGYVDRVDTAEQLLTAGKVRVALVIGDRFEQELHEGRPVAVQALVDGTFITTARVVSGYLDAINAGGAVARTTARVAGRLGVDATRAETLVRPLRIDTRYLYNEDLRTIWAIAPSLVMTILLWTAPLLIALNVVREKERGSLATFYASEATRLEFLLGKLAPCIAIAMVNSLVLWALATWYFAAPFRGSPAAFLAGMTTFVLSATTFGLLVAMWVRTQQAALLIVMLSGAIVGIHFSGMFEAVSSMPLMNRAIAHLMPAMYFNNVLQGTFLKGTGFRSTWRDIAITAVFAAGTFTVAYRTFHKRVAS